MSERLRSAPLGQEQGRFGSPETLPEPGSRLKRLEASPRIVKRSRRFLAALGRFFAAFGIVCGFCLVIVAGGLIAGLADGVRGLAVFGGLFLICLCVLAREEGRR